MLRSNKPDYIEPAKNFEPQTAISLKSPQHTTNGTTPNTKRDKRELLAIKVGSKIDRLISQLYEEHTKTMGSHEEGA
jgi:hypothetical protein